MGKPDPMDTHSHTWRRASRAVLPRFLIGLMLSLATTLVAFEWSFVEDFNGLVRAEPLPPEEGIDLPLAHRAESKPKTKEAKKPKRRTDMVVPLPDEHDDGDETDIDAPDEGTGKDDPGPDASGLTGLLAPDSSAGTGPPEFTLRPEVMPWFRDCLKEPMERRNACTGERMKATLARHFKVPGTVRQDIRTVVTFEVDREGRIGKVVCAPKVQPEVEAEVRRVLGLMPELIPGSQGGHPVGVLYQIPLNIRVLP